MKRTAILALLCIAAFSFSLNAQQPNTKLRPSQTIRLYPQGQSVNVGLPEAGGPIESNGLSGDETLTDSGNLGNIGDEARFDLYFPKKANGQMVVVCPADTNMFPASTKAYMWPNGCFREASPYAWSSTECRTDTGQCLSMTCRTRSATVAPTPPNGRWTR